MSDDRKWMQDFFVTKLDHAKREIVAARFFEIPAEAITGMGSGFCTVATLQNSCRTKLTN
jgi:hypothetical protein